MESLIDFAKIEAAYRRCLIAVSEADASAISLSQEEIKRGIELIASAAGLKGSLKVDSKWASSIVKKRQDELAQQRQNQLLSRIEGLAQAITDSEAYQAPRVRAEIQEISGSDLKQLKEIAASLNCRISAKKPEAFVVELLERMTGTSSVRIDQAVISKHLACLQTLYEKSVDSLPKAEIKEEMKQLKALGLPELERIAEQFGLENPGKSKPKIVKRIESRITASYNAKVANEI